MLGGKDLHLIQFGQYLAGERINLGDALDLVSPKADAVGGLAVCRHHLQRVAPHAKGPALQIEVVPLVIDADQVTEQHLAAMVLSPRQFDHDAPPLLGIADGIDARDGGDDDDVFAGEQGGRGGQAEAGDLFVDIGFLFDVQIVPGQVGLWLIIVVV